MLDGLAQKTGKRQVRSGRMVGHSETVRLGACRPFVELPADLKLPGNGLRGSVATAPLTEPYWG